MTIPIIAILLAAGLSRRMGEANKLLLPYKEKSILETTLCALTQTNVQEVMVVVGFEEKRICQIVNQFEGATVVDNPQYTEGMMTSIQAGIRAMNEESQGMMICLADMPFIRTEDYNDLIEKYRKLCVVGEMAKPIVRPYQESRAGNPVIFHPYYQKSLLKHTQKSGAKALIQAFSTNFVKMRTNNERYFKDIDTIEDYKNLQ